MELCDPLWLDLAFGPVAESPLAISSESTAMEGYEEELVCKVRLVDEGGFGEAECGDGPWVSVAG